MEIIGLYSTCQPIEPGSKFYPRMWYGRLTMPYNPQRTRVWSTGCCWWKFWRTYNPRGCEKQVYNRPEWLQYRTTLLGAK